jgi:hypothetical protein
MKGRLASKKAEVQVASTDTSAGPQLSVRLHRPEENVTETEILGNGPEAAAKVVDLLEDLGVL